MPHGFWTPERVRRLKAGAADGQSMSEVAETLGCTRNAVAGKAQRIDVVFDCPHERALERQSQALIEVWERDKQNGGARRKLSSERFKRLHAEGRLRYGKAQNDNAR